MNEKRGSCGVEGEHATAELRQLQREGSADASATPAFEYFEEAPGSSFAESIGVNEARVRADELNARRRSRIERALIGGGPVGYEEHFGDGPYPNGSWEEVWCEGGPQGPGPHCFQEIVFDDDDIYDPADPGRLASRQTTRRKLSMPRNVLQAFQDLRDRLARARR